MLKTLRKNTKLIIWLLVLSFILWGAVSVGSQFQKQGRVAGSIFGRDVSFRDYDLFYRANQILSFNGQKTDDPKILEQQTWQNLILAREAKKRKIKVSDEEVRAQILKMFAANKIENPDPNFYKAWVVQNLREPVADFERQLREMLKIQKLVQHVKDEPVPAPTPEEVHRRFVFEQNQLSAEWVQFAKQEEATQFYEGAKKAGNLNGAEKDKIQKTGMINLSSVMSLWQLGPDNVLKLMESEKGVILAPFALGNEFVVAQIVDKKAANEESFEKDFKQKYTEEIIELRRYEHFLRWSTELMVSARLKDYMSSGAESNV